MTEAIFMVHGSSSSRVYRAFLLLYLDVYDTMAATAYTKAFNSAQFYKSNQWYRNKCLKFAHMLILFITVVYRHINTLNFEIGT